MVLCLFRYLLAIHHIGKQHYIIFSKVHKYESKATKCIGVVIFKHKDDVSKIELHWQFVNSKCVFDQELENILKDNFPFRKSTLKLNYNRYK